MYDRILKLINEQQFSKIQQASILLVGVGGVGGYALECLIRSGFLHITVIDKDCFELSNLNRQILATQETIGMSKVSCAQKRASFIHPDVQIVPIQKELKEEDITPEFLSSFQYVIDACDSVLVKVKLLEECYQCHIPIISAMGTANRMHPEMMSIVSLKDTYNDPLAKKMRVYLKGKKCLNTKVVWSRELPKKQSALGTIASVPMASGALLASWVIQEICK